MLRATAIAAVLALVAVIGRYAWLDHLRRRVDGLCAQAQQSLIGDPASAEAERLLDEAIALERSAAKPHLLRGDIRARRGAHGGAIEDFRRAIDLEPASDWARLRLAQVLLSIGDRDAAKTGFAFLAERRPDTALGRYARGTLLMVERKSAEALGEFDAALGSSPPDMLRLLLLLQKAEALLSLGRFRDAAAAAAEAEGLAPSDARPYALRSWALYMNDQQTEALAVAEKALSLDTSCALAHLVRGQVFVGQLRFRDAIAEFDAAAADPMYEADARFARGYLRFQAGEYAAAAEDLARFVALRPDDPNAPDVRRLESEARKRIR